MPPKFAGVFFVILLVPMEILPIQTETILPPQDDLLVKIRKATFEIKEGDCIALTSKVVSIWQGRCILKSDVADYDALIRSEADLYIPRDSVPGSAVIHTIKNGYLISNAGIDGSNSDGHYVLWPKDPMKVAGELLEWFKKEYGVSKLYLVITDSRSVMLRRGAVGCAIAWAGFDPLYYHAGEKDVFGRPTGKPYTTNLPDSIAAAAVLAMGEVGESTPLAIVRGVPYFDRHNESLGFEYELEKKNDIYAPLLDVKWEKGGGGVV